MFLCFFPSIAFSSNIIDAKILRNQEGFGRCLVSSGFPLPEGLVTEEIIRSGKIKIIVEGREFPANISALRGRHNDGTLRSMLVQFSCDLVQGDIVPAQVVIGDGVRIYPDPEYIRPTLEIVKRNNVIIPTDPVYICSTRFTFQYLLPAGKGKSEEENQFTLLAIDRFESGLRGGTATYEHPRGLMALWARTGDMRFYFEALREVIFRWAGYNFPPPSSVGRNAEITNPDRVSWPNSANSGNSYQGGPEWHAPRTLSYASAYLLTGYRDFWSAVSASIQGSTFLQGKTAETQDGANYVFIPGNFDNPRYNYARYSSLFSAMMIDATIVVPTFWSGLRVDELLIQRAVNAIFFHEWDIIWLPIENWDQEFPTKGDRLVQGDVSGEILAIYFDTTASRHANEGLVRQEDMPASASNGAWWHRPSDNSWFERIDSEWVSKGQFPTSGYLQLRRSSIDGGVFSSGPVTSGINATVSGVAIDDYRNGFVGTRSYGTGRTDGGVRVFQAIFPANFLIDYYLNVYADERIPRVIYNLIRIVLTNTRRTTPGDKFWHNRHCGAWGTVTHVHPYNMQLPVIDTYTDGNPWILPEYSRLIAFVIKTYGDSIVNGKLLSEWYYICINTANNAPSGSPHWGHLTWDWKLFGQYYGMNQDAPWIMSQESLAGHGPSSFRKPTQYNAIPGDIPDIARE